MFFICFLFEASGSVLVVDADQMIEMQHDEVWLLLQNIISRATYNMLNNTIVYCYTEYRNI